jgi:cytoskeletal protein CcmA (bactofilin family)
MMDPRSPRSPLDPLGPAGGRGSARESLIDQDCFFEGTFRTPGNMRIEGAFKGVIECRGTLLVADSGQVDARIVAGSLIVAGTLEGEALCESRFEILPSGRVRGAITATATVVHEGAVFDGEIRMGGDGRAADSPAPAAPSMTAPGAGAGVGGRRRAGADLARTAAPSATEPSVEAPLPRSNGRQDAGAAAEPAAEDTAP